jgi:hypothetical protein
LAAVRFFKEAFADEPQLIADVPSEPRYDAACAAALAGCGQGKDADQSDDKERARLRRQALKWLRHDLAAWRSLLKEVPAKVRTKMRHWLKDPDFIGVRGTDALARFSEAERPDWQKLWADVAETLRKANEITPPRSTPRRGVTRRRFTSTGMRLPPSVPRHAHRTRRRGAATISRR